MTRTGFAFRLIFLFAACGFLASILSGVLTW